MVGLRGCMTQNLPAPCSPLSEKHTKHKPELNQHRIQTVTDHQSYPFRNVILGGYTVVVPHFAIKQLQILHPIDTFTNTPMYVYAWICMFYINFKMPVAMVLFVLFSWMCSQKTKYYNKTAWFAKTVLYCVQKASPHNQ